MSSKFLSAILIMALAWSAPAPYSFATIQYSQATPAFSDDELDQMLAPIALYPDPLLAQILPASSFGDQISEARQALDGSVDENTIENQGWDISVKAIAHYPGILNMMAQNPEWTAALGQAYVTQEPAVAQSIQRLRAQALNDGVLRSTSQQRVIVQANVIRIVPAQAHYIYVPEYDPYAIWGYPNLFPTPAAQGSFIDFGTGLLIGSWLNRDWDWHGRGPYYHGWRGGGWVGSSRRYVDTRNDAYVNNRLNNININRSVESQNTRDFRSRMERNAGTREKPHERPAPPPAGANPPPPSGAAPRGKPAPVPAAPAPVTIAPPAPASRTKPTPAPIPKEPPAAPTPQAKPAPTPIPAGPPAPATAPTREKPAPAPIPKEPPAAPTPQAKPAPAPMPAGPPAPAAPTREKPAPAPIPKAAPTAPTPQAKPAPAPIPAGAPAPATAPTRQKPAPAPIPKAAPAAPTPQAKPAPTPIPAGPPAPAAPTREKPAPAPIPKAAPTPPTPQAKPAPAPPHGGGDHQKK